MGSSEAPRAWSKYSAGSSANQRATQAEATGGNTVPLGEAPEAHKAAAKDKAKAKQLHALPEEGERLPVAPQSAPPLHHARRWLRAAPAP